MNIYTIEVDINIMKPYPQVIIDDEYNYGEERDNYFGLDFNKFSEYEMESINMLLKKNSLMTDILSIWGISGYGFLMNERVRNLFNMLRLPKHKYYNIKLREENSSNYISNYSWLHLGAGNLVKDIDYSRSKFFVTEFTMRTHDIILNSFDDYNSFFKGKEPGWGIFAEEIQMNVGFEIPYDIFTFHFFDRNIYVSERLKEVLEKEKIKGFKFEKIEIIKTH